MDPATDVSIETTWRVKDTCLCLHTQRAARALARRFDEALRPAGLTNEQFSLVNALNAPAPSGLGKLAAILGADRTTLTAALKRLEGRGLAASGRDPDDRRARRVALTDAGRAALAAALPLWAAAHAALEAELPAAAGSLRRDLLALSKSHEPAQETVR